ncbi:glycosyltransferase [Limosilactobacillus reuteri]|uniref:Glycosyl transferase n=3 Tax=Limosilactobacillus reuteri TaxID=1598 RepID=A0A256VH42_LIMRT|nr:glycosyltransferase [Limosilactobacillus reuteri]OYS59290.1 glycosyl transferase [Limosilactobacillus reuteri]OYS60543.1 glycosyl transferase [Limosilactobacillus reuteri]OYS65944.1 glycosyl transferase [Limosilactobacillus reuteri]OYS73676.1 glycosyl transferase [Limosilactobacillus reuteri]OYS74622.1 glycosyl transferase [Limosilactobacillus reuteri]
MGSEKIKQRILIIATTASMIEQFNIHNIKILQNLGIEVHVGTNFKKPGTITSSLSKNLKKTLKKMGVQYHQLDFSRGIGSHKENKLVLNQICSIIETYKISGIHAHSPLGGIIGRRAAHKMNIKILYTAHGFQFFKGGPLKDWLIFFPVEWFYARWTDALITINQQDYSVAHFLPVTQRYYIPGVGVDFKKNFSEDERQNLRIQTRKQLGVQKDEYLIISVGELSKRKNHETVLRAIATLKNPKIKYVIAGIGKEKNQLVELIKELGLQKQVQLLGYLEDLDGLYYAADLNVFVSKREGLGLGGLDGVVRGVYIIGNANTGMKDYILNKDIGLLVKSPTDSNELAKKIQIAMNEKREVKLNEQIQKFSQENVDKLMTNIYKKEFLNYE